MFVPGKNLNSLIFAAKAMRIHSTWQAQYLLQSIRIDYAFGPNTLAYFNSIEKKFDGNETRFQSCAKLFLEVIYVKMEQRILKIVNTCFYTNIYSYLEITGGPSYNPYLNVVHFFNTSLNYTSLAA